MLSSQDEHGKLPASAVCDETGTIVWFPTEELKVVSIEGQDISDILKELHDEPAPSPEASCFHEAPHPEESCPACGALLKLSDMECPSCGIVFLQEIKESSDS
ncbi:hypothetical protein [Paenibacillus hexagrammi]|uniref:Uncharacterized protein n=1 Tax=Paenibacillus hexagrammi TaxID=2908839 RepID=A0ABY3SFJ5_9BACL|nr:hypothetical protein [Paenibacillus sp. YPD9-1]UJF32582.1 hypothetical protein L0M14_23505 [Paenibacillus sp. YPD9-1]